MNEELIRAAIEEIKDCRKKLAIYYITIGSEKTQGMYDVIDSIRTINEFEQLFEEIRFKYNAMQQVK